MMIAFVTYDGTGARRGRGKVPAWRRAAEGRRERLLPYQAGLEGQSWMVSHGGGRLLSCSVLKCQALWKKRGTLCCKYVVGHVFWKLSLNMSKLK